MVLLMHLSPLIQVLNTVRAKLVILRFCKMSSSRLCIDNVHQADFMYICSCALFSLFCSRMTWSYCGVFADTTKSNHNIVDCAAAGKLQLFLQTCQLGFCTAIHHRYTALQSAQSVYQIVLLFCIAQNTTAMVPIQNHS